MPGFDDRLARELERAARPATPDPVRTFEHVARRRAHRTLVRKVQVVAMVIVLLVGTAGAFALLDDRSDGSQPRTPVDVNGTMTFTWVDRGSVIAGVRAMAGDGSNARELFPATLADGTWIRSVVVSSDGSRVAYMASQLDGAGPGGIVVADADGTDPRVVSPKPSMSSSPLAWSPDGSTIAATPGAGPDPGGVTLIAADGSGAQPLEAAAGAVSFGWAPDGRSLWVVTRDGIRSTIRSVPLTGNADAVVLPVSVGITELSVSPVDGTIAYVADPDAGYEAGATGDVWILDPETGDSSRLTTDGLTTDVAWSPDGSRVVMSVDGCAVTTMTPDGSDTDTVMFRDAAGGCPADVAWGPGLPTTFTPTPLRDEPPSAATDAEMLQWRPVQGIGQVGRLTCHPDDCTPGMLAADTVVLLGREDVAYALGPMIVDGTDVADAEPVPLPAQPDRPFGVVIQLDEAGTVAFSEASAIAASSSPPDDQIALVWRGEVVSAPTVVEAITSGTLQVSFATEQEAQALIDAVTAGAGSSSSPPPAEPEGEDIGLGTRLCDANELGGLDMIGDGTATTAWTGYPVNTQGRCPGNPRYLVAVDVTGDGSADMQWGPIERCRDTGCAPLGGTDLDADGDDELVIHTNFSIVDHVYFSLQRLEGGGFTLSPILVADPGNPAADIAPGEPLVTSAAGDEGYSAWIRCEAYPEAPVLVWAWTYSVVESNDPAEWHETKLALQDDGMFHVTATDDIELPAGERPDWTLSSDPACGIDFDIWSPPNPN